MSEWKECKLGDVIQKHEAELQTGPFGTMLKASEYVKTGTPVIAVQDIGENKLHSNKLNYIDNETAKRLERYRVQKNDIIFGRKGAVDRRAIVSIKEHGWIQGSDCIRLRLGENIDSHFISYQLGSNFIKEWLHQHSNGATMPSLNQEILSLLPLMLPPLHEQRAIASVLSSLDDKIDLLHRQSKTLEAMAETLFRQWFVEQADDRWDVKPLREYVLLVDNRGKTPPNSEEYTPYPVIEVNALGKNDRLIDYSVIKKYVDKETFNSWFRNYLQKYDILISTVGSIGAISMFIIESGNIAQNVIALHAKNISSFYIYQVLKHKTEELMQMDIGGVQPSIKVPHLLSILLPIPSVNIQKEFDNQLTAIADKMENNYYKIRTLEKLRDTLLPKLMSGEVQVAV